MSLKIMFITGSFPPMKCGVGDYTALLAESLAKRESISVAVLTSVQADRVAAHRQVKLYPAITKWNILSIRKIFQVIKLWQPDIVHIQYPTQGYGKVLMPNMLPVLMSILRLPVVQTWHESPHCSFVINALTRDQIVTVVPDYKASIPYVRRCFLWNKQASFIPIASNIPSALPSERATQDIRMKYDTRGKNLIAYFGFASPHKNIDRILDMINPERDRLVLLCELSASDPYHNKLLRRINAEPLAGRVFVAGYLSADQIALTLAAADAVVLPFESGASPRNGSFLAAKNQGTLVVTTHPYRLGYDCRENVHYSALGDYAGMSKALRSYMGRKRLISLGDSISWETIVEEHLRLYRAIITN